MLDINDDDVSMDAESCIIEASQERCYDLCMNSLSCNYMTFFNWQGVQWCSMFEVCEQTVVNANPWIGQKRNPTFIFQPETNSTNALVTAKMEIEPDRCESPSTEEEESNTSNRCADLNYVPNATYEQKADCMVEIKNTNNGVKYYKFLHK